MDLELKDKVAVITGGTTGIGKATAFALVQEGCKVIVCGRDKEKGKMMKQGFAEQGYYIDFKSVDVAKYDEVNQFAESIIDKYSKIDIWINNAGIYPEKLIIDMTEEEWDEAININLKSVFLSAKVVANLMKQADGGVILNAASFAAIIPSAGHGVYGATKAAIMNLTKSLAAELAIFNIRVNSYIPGVIETPLTKNVIKKNSEKILESIALNKIGRPEDVANVIAFLVSDKASYITGTHVEISGGKFCVQNPSYVWQMMEGKKQMKTS